MDLGFRIMEAGNAAGGPVPDGDGIGQNDKVTASGDPKFDSDIAENLGYPESPKSVVEEWVDVTGVPTVASKDEDEVIIQRIIDMPGQLERHQFLGACIEAGLLLEPLFASIGGQQGEIDRSILNAGVESDQYDKFRQDFDGVFGHGFHLARDIPRNGLSLGAFFEIINARLNEGGEVRVGYVERENSTRFGDVNDRLGMSRSLLLQLERPADGVLEKGKKPQITTLELVLHPDIGLTDNIKPDSNRVINALQQGASNAYVAGIWVLPDSMLAKIETKYVEVQEFSDGFGGLKKTIVVTDDRLIDGNVPQTVVSGEEVAPL